MTRAIPSTWASASKAAAISNPARLDLERVALKKSPQSVARRVEKLGERVAQYEARRDATQDPTKAARWERRRKDTADYRGYWATIQRLQAELER